VLALSVAPLGAPGRCHQAPNHLVTTGLESLSVSWIGTAGPGGCSSLPLQQGTPPYTGSRLSPLRW